MTKSHFYLIYLIICAMHTLEIQAQVSATEKVESAGIWLSEGKGANGVLPIESHSLVDLLEFGVKVAKTRRPQASIALWVREENVPTFLTVASKIPNAWLEVFDDVKRFGAVVHGQWEFSELQEKDVKGNRPYLPLNEGERAFIDSIVECAQMATGATTIRSLALEVVQHDASPSGVEGTRVAFRWTVSMSVEKKTAECTITSYPIQRKDEGLKLGNSGLSLQKVGVPFPKMKSKFASVLELTSSAVGINK
jgi:hypothetical protein